MKTYLRRKRQKLGILSLAAAVLLVVGINCSKLNRLDLNIGGINWNQADTVEFEHIWKERFFNYQSLLDSLPQQNIVIKNQMEWNALLNSMDSIDGSGTIIFSNFPVDFSQHQVLAVFDKARNDGVWGIEITNIVEQTCHIVVTYHIWKKVGTGTINNAIQAYHLVKIPISNKQVIFQEEFDNEVENVPYSACLYNYGDTVFLRGTAYLFIDSMPATQYTLHAMNIIYNTQDSLTNFYAYYPLSSQYSCFYNPCYIGTIYHYGSICNFPNFAKQWNGKRVYYRGFFREDHGPQFEFWARGYFVLTHLEEMEN